MYTKGGTKLAVALVAVLVVTALPAAADLLEFSGELSDTDAPITYFNATFDYTYDPATELFSLTVLNQTAWPNGYTISNIYFNVSDDVDNLTMVSNGGFWGARLYQYDTSNPSQTRADGFGYFDYAVDLGQGNFGTWPGSTFTFAFDTEGTDVTLADFFSGLSWDGGRTPAVGAVKFTQGTFNGDSVYAIPKNTSVVPEPASLILLGLGVAGMVARKRLA